MKINLTINELSNLIEGTTTLDPNFLIEEIKSLETASENDLSIFLDHEDASVFDPLSLDLIKKSNAKLIIASKAWTPEKSFLIVSDPLAAFQKLTNFIEHKNCSCEISPLASIHKTAKIAQNVTIKQFATIEENCSIGENSIIHSNVFIGKNCQIGTNVIFYPGVKVLDRCIIGNNTIIHSGSVIGSDGYSYKPRKNGLWKVPQIGIVRIGNHVEIGSNCCIDRAAFDETIISDGVKLDNLVHIAHNVKIGAHTAIIAQTGIAGGATVGMGCQIGGQVAIKDHIKIGNGVKIISKSGILKDLKDGAIVAGMPAIEFNEWKRLTISLSKLPKMVKLANELQSILEKEKTTKKSFIRKFFRWF
ncbi:TPA: UDP-3-O-(3-hydroxymyristoyl)glucosamine N-acyltransferase [Candidatus Dependentiae bacterium]|nr:MAG: UDP-3-O-acylglucosamine N-acyltransferase [candidate division TM6 bacterium GW2011_GWE2_31_21]KKP53709.1 MAG: UDP-3-O-acylglucosamine N-acyltransferase [candidate division TM6 bacterium GW2011_GWF2_33_332]HBS48539.1 UDP-3-O-(3-hydroxymyristoyl)glucosamine N-acyltransferase [Candidatus Dependentiae bacterium]HBZ73154.1 UDP-3-O-(3-hydroxymyristoyl)glucosamine N-acyltransferase [Candidatus Dependentiae bacterium]